MSHNTISDFLRREKLTPRGLWDVVHTEIDNSPAAYLIFDDSVQDKRYVTKMDIVYRQYSGAVHGVVDGIGVINLMHTSGKDQVFYPIDYRI